MNVDRKYPIGPLSLQEAYSPELLLEYIQIIEEAPERYRKLVSGLSDEALEATYREGGWTVRQLVHHVADMQFLHFMRMKKAVTESAYIPAATVNIGKWAATPDVLGAPVEDSLLVFEGIHRRYARLARSLGPHQFEISYFHPGRKWWINQKQGLAMSAWHVQHHYAHIELALGLR